MNKKRYQDLMENPLWTLTKEEELEGYHFCGDWDGRLIHKSWPAISKCSCENLLIAQRPDNGAIQIEKKVP